ncbi:hypothetical protein [Clostridium sp. UBA7339]|uniref:LptM family lipoprotein n=1 Tax=Clostridium sp. UBA7339 TaxID=1946376 RepID=UPI0032164C08
MKKIFSLLLCGIMILGLVGCGSTKGLVSKVESKYDTKLEKESNDYKLIQYYEHSIDVLTGYYNKTKGLIEKDGTQEEYQGIYEEYEKDKLALIEERNKITGDNPTEDEWTFFSDEIQKKFDFDSAFLGEKYLSTMLMSDLDNDIIQMDYNIDKLNENINYMLSDGVEGNSEMIKLSYEDSTKNIEIINKCIENIEK